MNQKCKICGNKMTPRPKSNVCHKCRVTAPESHRCMGITNKRNRCRMLATKGNYCENHYINIRKNGVPLIDTKYRLGSLQQMTKQELIEEILGTHDWDYLLEYGMVVEVAE